MKWSGEIELFVSPRLSIPVRFMWAAHWILKYLLLFCNTYYNYLQALFLEIFFVLFTLPVYPIAGILNISFFKLIFFIRWNQHIINVYFFLTDLCVCVCLGVVVPKRMYWCVFLKGDVIEMVFSYKSVFKSSTISHIWNTQVDYKEASFKIWP